MNALNVLECVIYTSDSIVEMPEQGAPISGRRVGVCLSAVTVIAPRSALPKASAAPFAKQLARERSVIDSPSRHRLLQTKLRS